MNKNIIKMIAVAITVISLVAIPTFADSAKKYFVQYDATSSATRKQNNGKNANRQVQNMPIVGDWIIRNANNSIKVELDRDGEMSIEWKEGFTRDTEWDGYWSATDTEISFNVYKKEVEEWGKKDTREMINATWKISYTCDGNTLTLNCADLPKEIAGGVKYSRKY